MGKLLKTWAVPEFQQMEFEGTLFQAMQFREYEPYVPRKGVVVFADEPFGLIVRVPRSAYDIRPRKLDGTPDERYRSYSPVYRNWYTVSDITDMCKNAIEDGDFSSVSQYVGRTTFQGKWSHASHIYNSAFVFEIPSLPIYFEGRFDSLHTALSLMELLASKVMER